MSKAQLLQDKLEWLTGRWWFYLIFVITVFTIPPYASNGYRFPEQWQEVTMQALAHTSLEFLQPLNPVFKIILVTLVALVVVAPKKNSVRIFNGYVALMYAINSIGSIAVRTRFGVAVCTINLIWFAIIAFCWALEACVLKNDFASAKIALWRYWVIPLAILAFWYPLDMHTGKPDFNPVLLLTSYGGLAFCLITPVYLALLTLYWPSVNLVVLRVTSLVGTFIGIMNMYVNFGIRPDVRRWNGVLHIPLLLISIYALVLSLKKVGTVSERRSL